MRISDSLIYSEISDISQSAAQNKQERDLLLDLPYNLATWNFPEMTQGGECAISRNLEPNGSNVFLNIPYSSGTCWNIYQHLPEIYK